VAKIPLKILDPDRDPGHRQNLIVCCRSHIPPLQKNFSKICQQLFKLSCWQDKFGFRKSRGTTDAIAALRVLYERHMEYNNKVYVCYVTMKKLLIM